MSKIYVILAAIVGFFVVIAMVLIGSYNGLVGMNAEVDGQWAQVESQYQRRFDLIPNLVETVKGSMAQEKAVFGAIADARTRYAGAATPDAKAAAAGQLDTAFSRLLVVMENYPELKSNQNVQTLMTQIEGTENRISVERMRYNDTVKTFNAKIKTFPTVLYAGIFGFKERTFFKSQEGAAQAPAVKF